MLAKHMSMSPRFLPASGPLLTHVRVAEERVDWLPPRRGGQRRQRGARLRGQLGALQRLARVKVEW